MNFKKTGIILSLLFCHLKVLSVPLNENELFSNLKDNYDTSENATGSVNIPDDEIYDTIPDDDINSIIKITDAVIEEETDSDSNDEVTIPAIDANECTSEECIEFSKRILSNMDTSVNPCDNFYEFTCGGWLAMNKDKYQYSHVDELINKINQDLHDMFLNDYKANEKLSPKEKEYDEKLFNLMKTTYTQCINSYKTNYNKEEFLLNYINKYKISSEKLSDRDNFTTLLAELHNNGISFLFEMGKVSSNGFSYEYIPLIKEVSEVSEAPYNLLNDEAFLEIELSKEGLTGSEGFTNEDEYNNYIQLKKIIIGKFQEYVKNILQVIYPSDTNKVNSMVESIIEVEKKLSRKLIDVKGYYSASPIYSTLPFFNINEIETENTDYYNDYEKSTDYIDNSSSTEGLNFEDNFDDNSYMDNNDNIVNIRTLNEKYPLINWKLYFEKRFEFYNIEIPINEESIIYESETFKYFYNYYKDINNNDLANYIEWYVINFLIDTQEDIMRYGNDSEFSNNLYIKIIPENLIQIKKEYKDATNIIEDEYWEMKKNGEYEKRSNDIKFENEEPLFKEDDVNSKCFNVLFKNKKVVTSKYYFETKFPENIKSKIVDMVENIRNAMIKRIQELEWLDESTRKYAIEKALKIKYILGYPDSILNNEALYNYYKPLENIHDDILSLIMGFKYIEQKSEYSLIYNENPENVISNIDKYLDFPSYEVGAFYEIDKNLMHFPFGIIQIPFFDINLPDYINYGSIGNIMGHELTHAFDNKGKEFDAEGRINNWWTNNDNEEFYKFSQCFIDQYGSYSLEINGKKNNIDGENTLSDNIADNGGINRAFEAWKMSIENNPEMAENRNMKLPGLSEYTMEQLFYIAFGHSYCQINNDENDIFENMHPPNMFRVNGVVSNSKRFAKIFNCPTTSPMNPEHKCNLW